MAYLAVVVAYQHWWRRSVDFIRPSGLIQQVGQPQPLPAVAARNSTAHFSSAHCSSAHTGTAEIPSTTAATPAGDGCINPSDAGACRRSRKPVDHHHRVRRKRSWQVAG